VIFNGVAQPWNYDMPTAATLKQDDFYGENC